MFTGSDGFGVGLSLALLAFTRSSVRSSLKSQRTRPTFVVSPPVRCPHTFARLPEGIIPGPLLVPTPER
jgi:hypothetical protein